MCYTIYLYHVLIISNVMARTIPLAWMGRSFAPAFAFQCLLIVPVVLAVRASLFVYTEKPFMRWGLSPVRGKSREAE